MDREVSHDSVHLAQAVVRIALKNFPVPTEASSAAEAVSWLCEHMREKLPKEALQDSNAFRAKYCYLPRVDAQLRTHRKTLLALFSYYSKVSLT